MATANGNGETATEELQRNGGNRALVPPATRRPSRSVGRHETHAVIIRGFRRFVMTIPHATDAEFEATETVDFGN